MGQTRKARTKDLRWVVNEIVGRKKRELVRVWFTCVAAHISIKGNQEANRLAKEATKEETMIPKITEGGLKQK